jgi:hypothetical protein
MDTVITIVNVHLATMSLLFTHLRLTDLALANTFALIFLNANSSSKTAYTYALFADGFVTFALGYPYFLTENKNNGVYLITLGLSLMMLSMGIYYRDFLLQYNEAYTQQDEAQVDEEVEDETSEESEEDLPTPVAAAASQWSTLRVEIPPVDVNALLAAEDEDVPMKED